MRPDNSFYSAIYSIALTLMVLISTCGHAQSWGDGEIESLEIEIVKDREITVPKASRNFSKIPPRPFEPITPPISYQFRNLSFQAPDLNPAVRPLRLKQEELTKIYGSNIKLGYGNFASPYLEATFNNKRDKQKHYGARVYHQSFGKGPVMDEFSAAGMSSVSLYGRAFGPTINLGTQLSLDNRFTHFFGFPENFDFNLVDIATVRQSFNRFSLKTDLSNTAPSKFNFKLGGGFSYLADNYLAKESEIALDLKSYFKINDNTRLNLNADYFLISRKDEQVEASPRHLFVLRPSFAFIFMDKFRLNAGLNFAVENDSIGKDKSFHLYPNIKAAYDLSHSVEVYAGISGDIEKVSLQSLTDQNLWLNANVPVFHSNKTFELFGGLNGKLGRRGGFGVGVSASNYKHLYFFLNEDTTPLKFDVVYDEGNTSVLKLFSELSFNHSEKFTFITKASLSSYIVDDIAEAWHRPVFEFSAQARYNVYDKVILKAESFVQSGLSAFDYTANSSVTLTSAVDVNLGVDYLISKKFNVFVQGTNLLNRSYPLFYQYPVRGLHVMVGLGYSF